MDDHEYIIVAHELDAFYRLIEQKKYASAFSDGMCILIMNYV